MRKSEVKIGMQVLCKTTERKGTVIRCHFLDSFGNANRKELEIQWEGIEQKEWINRHDVIPFEE